MISDSIRAARLEQWVEAYGNSILRTCFLYLADRALAEDAMQDTFVKVWRNMEQFTGRNDSSAKTWIMRIAINTCIDYKRSAWFKHVDYSKAVEDLQSFTQQTSAEAMDTTLALMHLPPKLKQVILLYYYHNMTMAEIAEVLSVNRLTVQRRLRKAYAELRFAPEGGEFQ